MVLNRSSLNILIVDDSKTICVVLKDIISKLGYQNVWAVQSVGQALELFKEIKFSIVFIDIVMPNRNGLELLKELKGLQPHITVIVMTSYPSLKSIEEAIEYGAYDYLRKPFNEAEIKLILKRVEERIYLLSQAGHKNKLEEEVLLDYLTGVFNHRHFQEVLSSEIEKAKGGRYSVCLAMIDIDDFKKYNDTYGHQEGDKLLRGLAQFFSEMLIGESKIFRYGGEEFAIVFPQMFKESVEKVLRKILEEENKRFPVSVSIGLASFPEDGITKNELIENADKALYEAKRKGKNRVCVFNRDV